MKKKNSSYLHSPRMLLLLVLVILMAVTAACSNNTGNTPADPGNETVPSPDNTPIDPAPEVEPEPELTPEEPTNAETPPAQEGDVPAEAETMAGEGTFVGIMDTHSIEIETVDGPTAFQYEDAMTEAINALEPDSQVQFEYYEETQDVGGEQVTQLWLVTIEAAQ
ncbi:hypothetical protein [Paenibacillus sp. 1P07SE]|uniref:hypothetical protein n=1 Tax=Paenibacillus sp. 1P07SE TaxID=3132209 RepID=UPI0039A52220